MQRIFTPGSPYKKQARFLAILWTLLIFIGCFYPGKELPKVDVPFIDKWVHLVLFGGFTFLWLCARPIINAKSVIILFLISVALGSFIEIIQGILTFLGRSMELMDAVADGVGGLLGIGVFCLFAYLAKKSGIS
ncbi:MAG: VanZ family protein [Chitinophagales bacterium]